MRSKKQPRHANLPEVQVELARRSVSGAMSYFGLLLVVGFFTPYASDHPHIFNIAVGAFLVMGMSRIILARAIERRIAGFPNWGFRAFGWGVMSSAAFWGMFSALTLGYYQSRWTGMIVLLMTAGIAAGGLTSLVPDIFLARSYLVVMLLPSIVASAILGNA
ncbi:MAG TPA: hypothetical protein VMT78_07340, partial [Terriglobia bacterium]|nr:hypothetical protein [Terriglobia bacterium]